MSFQLMVLANTNTGNSDPDSTFHFDADPHPDPTFHFDADPDPDPTFHFDVDPDPDADLP